MAVKYINRLVGDTSNTTDFLRKDGTRQAPGGGPGGVSDGDKGDITVSGTEVAAANKDGASGMKSDDAKALRDALAGSQDRLERLLNAAPKTRTSAPAPFSLDFSPAYRTTDAANAAVLALEYTAGAGWRRLSSGGNEQGVMAGGPVDVQSFTTAGAHTWTKPTSFTPSMTRVLEWGGAGGLGGVGRVIVVSW